ncbi:hypothetical protein JIX59_07625 [Brevundimonas diminuta]|uniref:hypothetical protein n=1 Tax=Brevundimonas diminuta TaxID=293 RepID=UPI0019050D94|nr:hypothetical protein [Brevundimonas diminuta]MBK1969206.1 hypothetical protein [Brevundimonas diminuta]
MKKVFAFLILCMALALARILLMVLAVVLLLALVHAFVTRPWETMVFIATLILSSLAVAQPLAFIGGVVVVVLVLAGFGRWRRGRHPRSLLPSRPSGH